MQKTISHVLLKLEIWSVVHMKSLRKQFALLFQRNVHANFPVNQIQKSPATRCKQFAIQYLGFSFLTSWTNKKKKEHDHQSKHPRDLALAAALCTAFLVLSVAQLIPHKFSNWFVLLLWNLSPFGLLVPVTHSGCSFRLLFAMNFKLDFLQKLTFPIKSTWKQNSVTWETWNVCN